MTFNYSAVQLFKKFFSASEADVQKLNAITVQQMNVLQEVDGRKMLK